MKIKAVALISLLALAGLAKPLLAEERTDVLERIAPIGQVNVEGQSQAEAPAPAPAAETAATDAPAAEMAAEQAPAAEAPAAEAPAAEAPAPAAAGEDELALATQSGCMACHQIETKVVGPAYKDVAAKYDAGALEMLVAKVKSGGVGTWGQIPMPPNAHIPDDDIRKIVSWILSL